MNFRSFLVQVERQIIYKKIKKVERQIGWNIKYRKRREMRT